MVNKHTTYEVGGKVFNDATIDSDRQRSSISDKFFGTGFGKTVTKDLIYTAIAATAAFGLNTYISKDETASVREYVNVPVSTDILWNVYTSRDKDKGIFAANTNDWDLVERETYAANGVKNNTELSRIMRNKGQIKVPKDRINPNFDF